MKTRPNSRQALAFLFRPAVVAALLVPAAPSIADAATSHMNTRMQPSSMYYGTSGSAVRRLQHRLDALKYYTGETDGWFGAGTKEAVWAFQEVQGLPVSGVVSRLTERALAHPRGPYSLVPDGGQTRVEVNLGRRVLSVYHHNRVVLISHISAGGGYYFCDDGRCSYAHTPTGDFHTTWRVHGWHVSPLGLMYNPVFFYGGYAIHGDSYVPVVPVSHGCVRVPMDVANVFPHLVPHSGTPVYVRW